jgi:GT2 family glycosyltransferase
MKKIFVIVVTFNGEKWISRCLNSLRKSSVYLNTIIVDNGSTDRTIEISKHVYPEAEIFYLNKNIGFGQANNIGIVTALKQKCNYVFLLNQDAWIEEDTIDVLTHVHKCHPEYGIISPMHLNSEGNALDYYFSKYMSPAECPGLISDIYINKTKKIYEATFVNAAAWLVSADCILKVGLFDNLFFHYGEDKNYCQRVKYYSFKIGICPHARIVHDRTRTKMEIQYQGICGIKRNALFHLADINNARFMRDLRKNQKFYFFKILTNIIFCNFKLLKESFTLLKYFFKIKRQLITSQVKNRSEFHKSFPLNITIDET